MTRNTQTVRKNILATVISAITALQVNAGTSPPAGPVELLTATFEARQVEQVEVGDFHFLPGQIAPIHTHTAPAVGYVAKGMIIYQIEGEKPQILRQGDAFYEPAGPRILRFDNASATEEAIFMDFNLEQAGEPFIVFEQPPTEAIDRRTLPTVALGGKRVSRVDVAANLLQPKGALKLGNRDTTLSLVAEGAIELRVNGGSARHLVAGNTFSMPSASSEALIINTSSDEAAKIITFRLR